MGLSPLETPGRVGRMNATTHAVTAPAAVFPHYDRVQRILHWSMAAIIIVAVAIGLYCSFLVPGTPARKMLLDVHKSLGMTALALAFIRTGYRLLVSPPAYLEPLGRLTRAGASSAHLSLYGLMLFMPITGYMFSAAGLYVLGGRRIPAALVRPVPVAARSAGRQGTRPLGPEAARVGHLGDLCGAGFAYR